MFGPGGRIERIKKEPVHPLLPPHIVPNMFEQMRVLRARAAKIGFAVFCRLSERLLDQAHHQLIIPRFGRHREPLPVQTASAAHRATCVASCAASSPEPPPLLRRSVPENISLLPPDTTRVRPWPIHLTTGLPLAPARF